MKKILLFMVIVLWIPGASSQRENNQKVCQRLKEIEKIIASGEYDTVQIGEELRKIVMTSKAESDDAIDAENLLMEVYP